MIDKIEVEKENCRDCENYKPNEACLCSVMQYPNNFKRRKKLVKKEIVVYLSGDREMRDKFEYETFYKSQGMMEYRVKATLTFEVEE